MYNLYVEYDIQIKLLSENKLTICAFANLYYQIPREKFEPEPGFEPRTSRSLAWRVASVFKDKGLNANWQLNQDSLIGRAPGPRFESRFRFKLFS